MVQLQVTLTPTAQGVAPTGDETLGTSRCTRSWQGDSSHTRVDGGR